MAAFQVGLVKVLMVLLLSGCVWWLPQALFRRRRKRPFEQTGALGWARWAAVALAMLNVFFFVEMLHLLTRMDGWDFIYAVPPAIKALLWIPIVTTVLVLVVLLFAVWTWRCRLGSVWNLLHYSLVAAAGLVLCLLEPSWLSLLRSPAECRAVVKNAEGRAFLPGMMCSRSLATVRLCIRMVERRFRDPWITMF